MTMIERKVALVTGAGRRIGRAMALHLAERGWAVAVHYFSSKHEADEVVAACVGLGVRAAAIQANLAREADTDDLIPDAESRLGPITLLVNNASMFERDEIATVTRDSWDTHMEVNLRAPMVLSQAMAARLPAGRAGAIVNMLDQRVWNLTPHFMSYTVSKSALWTLTRTMAMALAPAIRVNGIGPGPTMRNERQSEAHFRAQWESVPMRRPTTAAEICGALQFLIDTPTVTGQMIALDGGEHMGWAQPRNGIVPVE